jgi:hypothetical protein
MATTLNHRVTCRGTLDRLLRPVIVADELTG